MTEKDKDQEELAKALEHALNALSLVCAKAWFLPFSAEKEAISADFRGRYALAVWEARK